MKQGMKKTLLASCLLAITTSGAWANGLVSMSDEELSSAQGQALISMAYTAPTGDGTGAGSTNNYLNYGYYKLGLEAKMELNANIRSLQLGCGGRNGPDNCDIDIENLSLSGPADGSINNKARIDQLKAITNRTTAQQTELDGLIAIQGTPTWSQGRANTSAVLTNPFIEFAVKNPTSAATREVVGFRLSAENILGHMSAGTINDKDPATEKSTGGGINSFSGYLQVATTPVNAFTDPAMFGTTPDQIIYAKITALGFDRTSMTNPNKMTPGQPGYVNPQSDGDLRNAAFKYNGNAIWGINVPSQFVQFNFPQTSVTGSRMSQLNLVVNDVPIPTIPIGANSGALAMTQDQSIVGLAGSATFFMGAKGTTAAGCAATINTTNCSYITNLKTNVTVKQNFNLIHNLPITSGGYLSLQKEALRWPGSASAFTYDLATQKLTPRSDSYVAVPTEVMNQGDIAQPGWWLSFKDPLDFGELNPTTGIPMQDVLPQIATFITNYLSQNNIALDPGTALGAAFGAPIYKGIGNVQLANDARAIMVLQNLLLDGNQKPVANCFGGLKFC